MLEENRRELHSVICGQCSETMQVKIRQEEDFKTSDNTCNVMWLLKTIRGIMFKFEGIKDNYLSMIKTRSALDRLYQDRQENTLVLYYRFVLMVDAFENYGGTIGGEDGLIESPEDKNDPYHPVKELEYSAFELETSFRAVVRYYAEREKHQDRLKKISRGMMLAMMYLKKVDRKRFEGLQTNFHTQYSRGMLQYPQDLTAAYAMITSHRLTASTTSTRTERSDLILFQIRTKKSDTGQG